MDHKLGSIGLVTWQNRPSRRFKSGVKPWTVVVAACAIVGAAVTVAEAMGWLTLTGPLAAAPPALIVLAISAQLVAVARAFLAWFVS